MVSAWIEYPTRGENSMSVFGRLISRSFGPRSGSLLARPLLAQCRLAKTVVKLGGKLPFPTYTRTMTTIPTFKLSRLRDIGWGQWDPIGIAGPNGSWPEEAVDEYDSYLLQAAAKIWNQQTDKDVTDYLVEIETVHMGLSLTPGLRERALTVTRELRAYVEGIRR